MLPACHASPSRGRPRGARASSSPKPAQHAWDKETSLSQPSLQGIGSSLLSVDEGRQVDEHGDILTRAQRAYAAQDWRSAAARFDAVPPERLTADDLAAYADAVW